MYILPHCRYPFPLYWLLSFHKCVCLISFCSLKETWKIKAEGAPEHNFIKSIKLFLLQSSICIPVSVGFVLFFSWCYWDFNSERSLARHVLYHSSHTASPHLQVFTSLLLTFRIVMRGKWELDVQVLSKPEWKMVFLPPFVRWRNRGCFWNRPFAYGHALLMGKILYKGILPFCLAVSVLATYTNHCFAFYEASSFSNQLLSPARRERAEKSFPSWYIKERQYSILIKIEFWSEDI